jgi:hypothetical protein
VRTLLAENNIQHLVLMKADRAVKGVIFLHCRSSQEKSFLFSQMVINNTMLQVFKGPEKKITFIFSHPKS